MVLSSLVFAAALTLDGAAAKEHASKLAALGPHPYGSPRGRFAAEFVAAQFRAAGLQEVRQQEVEAGEARGANVLGVLRGPGTEFVVLAAHHDTAQDSPGAYGSGAGVGLLIEAARVLGRGQDRPRTNVFASFDGREPRLGGRGGLGARAYVQALGKQGRDLVGAFVLDRAGRKGLSPSLEVAAYPDPLRPGSTLVAPEGLARAAVGGAALAGESITVGDPLWPWLYQAGVRTFRVRDLGDDRPFLEAGLPALRLSARRFLARDPHDLTETDTAEHLDDEALSSTGRALLGGLTVLQNAARPGADPDWFLGLGRVLGRSALLLAGALSLLPGLVTTWRGPRLSLGLRLVHVALFGLVLYRHPVPTLFAFFLWNVLTAFGPRLLGLVVGALPVLALLTVGGLAWSRGLITGVHLAVWELVIAAFAAALALALGRRAVSRSRGGGRHAGGRKGLAKG
ncbi:MAG TPA: M28 family peptidase [Vicinamibacteria bacterium]